MVEDRPAPSMHVDVATKHSSQELREMVADGCLSVRQAVEFSGIKRTRLFELISSGRLVTFLEGRNRVIPKRELQRYLAERLEEEQAKQRGEVT
jgi:hypothetical protein